MNIYLDESGDLGWTFDRPYGKGGSSRFLTIAALIVPKELSSHPKRIVRQLYKKRGTPPSQEIKGANLNRDERLYVANRTVKLLQRKPKIKLAAITVRKERVQPHIRADSNKLYNYMTKLLLLDKIKKFPSVDFIPDPRTIKVQSGNSLVDYLQTELWFEHNALTTLHEKPSESRNNLGLQYVDFVAHIVWRNYERNSSAAFNVLKRKLDNKVLFF